MAKTLDKVAKGAIIYPMITLHRATNRAADSEDIPVGTCWTPNHDDAIAYSDRPNYEPRKHLVQIVVDENSALDLTGDNWAALNDALGYDVRETWTDGDLDYIEQAIDDPKVRAKLAAHKWVRYDDTYPDQCETWVRL